MKVRDNIAIFAVAAAGAGLQVPVFILWLLGRKSGVLNVNLDEFLLLSQIYLLALCLLVYWIGRRVMRPFESILDAIALYGQGRFDRRIAPSAVKEIDDLAKRLNRMADDLSDIETLKNDFIANVSHELRSPLAAMEDYLKILLSQEEIAGQNRANCLRINNNISRLRHLVEDILDASRIETRQVKIQAEPFAPEEIVREVSSLFKPRLDERRIGLQIVAASSSLRILGDVARARQILVNLMDNAVKYNRPDGRIVITVSSEGGQVKISFEDTGIGIAPDKLGFLFQRFRRIAQKDPEAARIKGVGLGLAISRSLARLMCGDIQVQSELGRGSVFSLILPQAPEERPA